MRIIKFFIKQFKYQLQNSFNVKTEFSQFEALNYLGFLTIITILPLIAFLFWILTTFIMLKLNLTEILLFECFQQINLFELYTFIILIIVPISLFMLFSCSYISFLIKCLNNKKLGWFFVIIAILLINIILYYLVLHKGFV
jgi:hypothetical protein